MTEAERKAQRDAYDAYLRTCILDPSATQPPTQIEAYLCGVAVGDEVAIRSTCHRVLSFVIAKVLGTKLSADRLYTDRAPGWSGAAWDIKSGKSCSAPAGPATLVVPTEAVREFIRQHPQGVVAAWTTEVVLAEARKP